jgi:hypothetical protein
MASEFLHGVSFRSIRLGTEPQASQARLTFGNGASPLEIVVMRLESQPSKQQLKNWWKLRKAARPAPLLLVVLTPEGASVCGPTGEEPPIHTDLDLQVLDSPCREALEQPDRHAALRSLRDALPAALAPVTGVRNEGLLATHELQVGARRRAQARRRAYYEITADPKKSYTLNYLLTYGLLPAYQFPLDSFSLNPGVPNTSTA